MRKFFATASAGTEDLLTQELSALGLRDVRPARGLVRFSGEFADALKACLWSRVAMRVLHPIANFPATDGDSLYAGARAIRWTDWLDPTTTFAVEATGTTPELRHTHFTGLRIKDAVVDVLREKHGARPDVDPKSPAVRVVAHLSRGRCEVSLDVSGEPLFKRGYRLEPTKASLKETLAASVLLAAGYDGTEPLVDPMCGSGTLALEAALIAHGRAPGLTRAFGIERWPLFDDTLGRRLQSLRDQARSQERRDAPPILARDRDRDAVQATGMNAARLKLPVKVELGDARELPPSAETRWIVANPPYGERLAPGRKALKSFFWQLGQGWRKAGPSHVAVLAGGPEFESAFGARPVSKRRLWNGPIECTLLRYELGTGGVRAEDFSVGAPLDD